MSSRRQNKQKQDVREKDIRVASFISYTTNGNAYFALVSADSEKWYSNLWKYNTTLGNALKEALLPPNSERREPEDLRGFNIDFLEQERRGELPKVHVWYTTTKGEKRTYYNLQNAEVIRNCENYIEGKMSDWNGDVTPPKRKSRNSRGRGGGRGRQQSSRADRGAQRTSSRNDTKQRRRDTKTKDPVKQSVVQGLNRFITQFDRYLRVATLLWGKQLFDNTNVSEERFERFVRDVKAYISENEAPPKLLQEIPVRMSEEEVKKAKETKEAEGKAKEPEPVGNGKELF